MFAASDTDFIVGCFKQKLMKEHKHLKQCHPGKSRQDNFVLPVERPEDRNLVKNTDRQRCKCEVIGCCYYGISVSRLDRHMRKVDTTTTKELEKKESMAECSFSSQEDLSDADSCLFSKITRIVNNLSKLCKNGSFKSHQV